MGSSQLRKRISGFTSPSKRRSVQRVIAGSSSAFAPSVACPARERELTRRRGIDPVTSGSVRRWRCEGLPLSCSCLRVFARSILRSRQPAPKPMRPAFRSACAFTASSPTLTAATPPYLNATPQRRVGRRNVSSIPTPIHTSRAPASSSAPRGTGGIDTIKRRGVSSPSSRRWRD